MRRSCLERFDLWNFLSQCTNVVNVSNRPSIIKYVALGLIAIVVLIIFNSTRRPPTSDLQFRYNAWFTSVEGSLRPGTNAPPQIMVSLSAAGEAIPPGSWEIKTGTTATPDTAPQARDNMYRILQLIHESNVFGLDSIAEDDTTTGRYKLRVDHNEDHFMIAIPAKYVAGNIQAQNLVKLIQLYAASVATPVVVPGQL